MTFRAVMYCVVPDCPDCRCEHRFGCTIYVGESRADAEQQAALVPEGYEAEIEEMPIAE